MVASRLLCDREVGAGGGKPPPAPPGPSRSPPPPSTRGCGIAGPLGSQRSGGSRGWKHPDRHRRAERRLRRPGPPRAWRGPCPSGLCCRTFPTVFPSPQTPRQIQKMSPQHASVKGSVRDIRRTLRTARPPSSLAPHVWATRAPRAAGWGSWCAGWGRRWPEVGVGDRLPQWALTRPQFWAWELVTLCKSLAPFKGT